MRSSQRKIKDLSRLLLAVVLFAQGILAAHACVEPLAGAAQSLSSQQATGAMHCHEATKVNANECLMHCTQSDQVNLDQHDMTALPVQEVVLHVVKQPLQQRLVTAAYTPAVLNSGPPLSISFCSYQL